MSESKLKDTAEPVVSSVSSNRPGLNLIRKYRQAGLIALGVLLVVGAAVGWHYYTKVPTRTEIDKNIGKGNYKTAEDQIKRSISKSHSNQAKADLYRELGSVYADENKSQQAIAAYQQAAAVNGMTAQIARTIAATYYFSGNKQQAIVYYQKALDLWPKSDPLYGAETRALKQTIADLQK